MLLSMEEVACLGVKGKERVKGLWRKGKNRGGGVKGISLCGRKD